MTTEKSKKTIDVVYIMDNRSKRANLELAFSLRSIKKHLKNYRKIHIFGSDMSTVVKATATIKHHVTPPVEGENNMVRKHALIDVVCKNKDVSDDFILVSDDCFLLENQDANSIPLYYSGTLEERILGYRNQISVSVAGLTNTRKILKNYKRKDKYFNTHAPFPINKKDFLKLRELYYLEEFKGGLIYKSLYCNHYKKRGRFTPNRLVYRRRSRESLEAKLHKATFFAVADSGLTNVVIMFLNDTFPKKPSWEK